jgi:hypothetical protein
MRASIESVRKLNIFRKSRRTTVISCVALICSTSFFTAAGQAPTDQQSPQPETQQPSASAAPQGEPAAVPAAQSGLAAAFKNAPRDSDGAISEEQFRQQLLGKTFFLRGVFLNNNLDFDEHGNPTGDTTRGSYTLCAIKINKAKFTKRKLELEGDRYALHFLGELPHEDPLKDVQRVKITPKKKIVKIAIEREQVEKPKKQKHLLKPDVQTLSSVSTSPTPAGQGASPNAQPVDDSRSEGEHFSETTTPAHASRTLVAALDLMFAQQIDDRMIAQMPDFWKLYYKAAAANTDYVPADHGILGQNSVDQKAKLLTTIDPPSNEYAQANEVAGMALYHAIIGTDGKAAEVVAARPIGFGLDESAVAAIRNASFQPAIKDGKPVPVVLDLVVSFRIYSNRTSQPATQQTAGNPGPATMPGPYSVQRPVQP